jgi:hypothetical protein
MLYATQVLPDSKICPLSTKGQLVNRERLGYHGDSSLIGGHSDGLCKSCGITRRERGLVKET